MRATTTRVVLLAGLVLSAAWTAPCVAATGSWSSRSSGTPTQLWTRAGLVRTRATSEIVPARTHHHVTPRMGTGATPVTLAGRLTSEQRQNQRSPSSARTLNIRSSTAHLRMSSAPDRRARSAHLAVLAGIFYEAHAPPASSAPRHLA